jgi:hypothetical protein
MPRGDKANHRCELEMVFVNTRLNVTASDGTDAERDVYHAHHQGHFKCVRIDRPHGCCAMAAWVGSRGTV